MAGDRPRRVAEQIQRHLSAHLIPSLRDPRLGFATVTGVEVARDLRSARVFVTFHETDEAKRHAALLALRGASGFFRREVGRSLHLRYAPEIRFEEDLSVERAGRIEKILHDIRNDRGEDESE